MIKVFKFGGASIMDVQNIKNVGNILQEYANQELVIVFSAMGKVTNMLENVVTLMFRNQLTLILFCKK